MSVYLITGASSDVGTALIDRLYREGDVFIAQGAGDLSHLAPLCRKYPGAIKTYDVDLTDPAALELFVRDDFLPLDDGTCLPQLGWFDTSFRFPAVKENNLVWMTVTPNEINTIQPCVRQSHGKVLTFGLGLGYYAFHCLLKPDVRRVTVVERDPDIISLFRALLLPHFPRPDALEIIQADAFDFASKHLPAYDVVFTDLWHDVSDGLPLYQRMKALEVPGVKYLYWIEQTLRCYLR